MVTESILLPYYAVRAIKEERSRQRRLHRRPPPSPTGRAAESPRPSSPAEETPCPSSPPASVAKKGPCRICWDEEGEMIAPCLCKGSVRWVHPHCLLQSRRTAADASRCLCCGFRYRDPPATLLQRARAYTNAIVDEAYRWCVVPGAFLISGWTMTLVEPRVCRSIHKAALAYQLLPDAEWTYCRHIATSIGAPSQSWQTPNGLAHCSRPVLFAMGINYVAAVLTTITGVAVDCGVYRAALWTAGVDVVRDAEKYPLLSGYDFVNSVCLSIWHLTCNSLAWAEGPGKLSSSLLRIAAERIPLAVLDELTRSWERVRSWVMELRHQSVSWTPAILTSLRREVVGWALSIGVLLAQQQCYSAIQPIVSNTLLHLMPPSILYRLPEWTFAAAETALGGAVHHVVSTWCVERMVESGVDTADLPIPALVVVSIDFWTYMRGVVGEILYRTGRTVLLSWVGHSFAFALRPLPQSRVLFAETLLQSWRRVRNSAALELCCASPLCPDA